MHHRHRAVLGQQQRRHRLADNIGAAKHDRLGPGRSGSTSRSSSRQPYGVHGTSAAAAPQLADVLRMKTVYVLARIDRRDDTLWVDMFWQRQLHQNAVDRVVGIQARDQPQQFGFGRGGRQVF